LVLKVSGKFQESFREEKEMKGKNPLTSVISKGITKLTLGNCSRPPFLNHKVVMRNGGLKRPFEITEKEILIHMIILLW
jgi:hypothetical protein